MEVQVLLCLLLLHSTLKANAMCQRGQLRMVGIVNMNYAIGRMELCNDRVWRKICGWRWGANDAKVACQQMGFFDRATRVRVSFCGNSCYGTSSLNEGLSNFGCSGNEQNLINCSSTRPNGNCNNAGVACVKVSETVTETFPNFVATTKEQMVTTVTERGQCTQVVPSVTLQTSRTVTPPSMQAAGGKGHPQAMEYNCASLSGGLGALAALMAIGMMGVALGWAWSCHRRKGKSTIQEITADHALFENPAYSVSQPCPLVRYSSTGPQDNPTHGTLEGVSSTYDIIKNDPSLTEGEHDYQVLEEMEGGAYEVPVNTGGNVTSIDNNQEV